MLADYPKVAATAAEPNLRAEALIEMVTLVRNVRGENNIKPNAKLSLIVLTTSTELTEDLKTFDEVISALGGLKFIEAKNSHEKKDGQAHGVGTGFEVYLDLSEGLDVAAETTRLNKEQEKLDKKAAQIQGKLNNPGFLAKAPQEVVDKNKAELAEIEAKLEKIKEALSELGRV